MRTKKTTCTYNSRSGSNYAPRVDSNMSTRVEANKISWINVIKGKEPE